MLQRFLTDVKFFELLLAFDSDLAEKARLAKCPNCGSSLHQAHFPRKSRGVPDDLDIDLLSRFSFCCYKCRKRLTPPSLRFFGPKVYFGAIMLLISAMLFGASPSRRRRLRELCGANNRTLGRWRKWWREVFPQTHLWKSTSARFALFLESSVPFPRCLFHVLRTSSLEKTLLSVLGFLLPMTGGRGRQMSTILHGC